MATSTMHATKGGIISCRPLISPPDESVGGAARAECAAELRDPEVHEVEVAGDAWGAPCVRRHNHGLCARLLRQLSDLFGVVILRAQDRRAPLHPHFVSYPEPLWIISTAARPRLPS